MCWGWSESISVKRSTKLVYRPLTALSWLWLILANLSAKCNQTFGSPTAYRIPKLENGLGVGKMRGKQLNAEEAQQGGSGFRGVRHVDESAEKMLRTEITASRRNRIAGSLVRSKLLKRFGSNARQHSAFAAPCGNRAC